MDISKAKANKIIEACFRAIPYNLFDSFWEVRERLYEMNLDAEKQHRRNRGAVKGFSMSQAAKYFTVKHLFEALENPNQFTVDHILYVRKECLYAQAYANKFKNELQDFKKFIEESDFNKVDYSDMME